MNSGGPIVGSGPPSSLARGEGSRQTKLECSWDALVAKALSIERMIKMVRCFFNDLAENRTSTPSQCLVCMINACELISVGRFTVVFLIGYIDQRLENEAPLRAAAPCDSIKRRTSDGSTRKQRAMCSTVIPISDNAAIDAGSGGQSTPSTNEVRSILSSSSRDVEGALGLIPDLFCGRTIDHAQRIRSLYAQDQYPEEGGRRRP